MHKIRVKKTLEKNPDPNRHQNGTKDPDLYRHQKDANTAGNNNKNHRFISPLLSTIVQANEN
jgi:hypothetical protein